MANNLKLINTNTINSKPIRNYIKVKNTGGPKGDTGATGATGPQGPQGPAGQAATINIGETTTLLPGQTATVTNTGTQQNATLNFGIPQGLRGPTGAQGPKGDTGPQGLKGDKGNDGAAATIQVNATNTGEPGTNAQVVNIGNEHFAQLNFTIPRGATGATGAQGPRGPQGQKGDKGDAGSAATVTVGSTTTTSPGTSATVTNSGTTSAAVLNFGIPSGAPGKVKSEVVAELPDSGEDDTFYLVNREATTQTVTGKTINFTNSENAGDITDAQIDGETAQTAYTGKNLAKIPITSGYTSNGITWVSTPTSVAGSGTASGTWANVWDNTTLDKTLPAGTYTLSFGKAVSVPFTLRLYDENNSSHTQEVPANTTTFTFTTTYTTAKMYGNIWGLTSGQKYNFDFGGIQLESGSSATAYEPYVGGKASPNPNYPQAVRTVTGENVVKICGKNLFDKDNVVNGIPSSIDGTIISPTSDGRTSGFIPVKASTGYYFSGHPAGWATVSYFGPNKSFISRVDNTSSITTPSNCEYVRVSCSRTNLETCQFEKGTTATAYEAYKGQNYKVNLDLMHGKNMLDPSTLVDGYISVNGEYNAAHSNGEMRSGMIAVSPSTAYTFSIQATSSTYDPWFGVGEYTADNVASFVQRNTNSGSGVTSITFTTSATTNYIAVSARNLKAATKVQLEQSNSVTTYEPWSPIELCKIGDYQDYIYKSDGKWYVHKATKTALLDGSEQWGQDSSGGFQRFNIIRQDAIPTSGRTAVGLSTYFHAQTTDSVGAFFLGATGTTRRFYFYPTTDITTIEYWLSWLSSQNVKLVYPLAIPTDTEITNQALIAQLDALAGASLYSGVNNITTITPNELPTLELDYVTYDKYNQNKVYIWNDDLEQWQIIVQ